MPGLRATLAKEAGWFVAKLDYCHPCLAGQRGGMSEGACTAKHNFDLLGARLLAWLLFPSLHVPRALHGPPT